MKKEKQEKEKSIFIRCSSSLWLRIAQEALNKDISRNKLVTEILEKNLPLL